MNLETERLLLRHFTEDDVDAMYALGSHPLLIKYAGNKPLPSREAAAQFLRDAPLKDYATYGYGRHAVVWKESGQIIGFSGVKYIDEIDETELGYRLFPEFWHKGIATEAGRAVLPYAKNHLKLNRVVAMIHPENEASKNVVRRLDFQFEKHIRHSLIPDLPIELFSRSL